MNKSELIEALAQDIGVPHREAAAITNTVIDTMTEALARGESIEIIEAMTENMKAGGRTHQCANLCYRAYSDS